MIARSPLIALATLLACGGDFLAPLSVGEPHVLRHINGQPVPWTTPDGPWVSTTITEGWVTLQNDSIAERHERFGRWLIDANGDSIPLFAEWTQTAAYERQSGILILTYHFWTFGSLGPSQPTETLYVRRPGVLVLRQTGFIPPIDSMVREYCTQLPNC